MKGLIDLGLITEEIKIKINKKNIKWYTNKNYKCNLGDVICVKTQDLSLGTHILVDVQCDECNNIHKVVWKNYLRYVKKGNKYYCNKCSRQLFGYKKMEKTLLHKHGNSFEEWCVKNSKEEILDRWDYKLNNKKPFEILCKTTKKFWFKCPRGLHGSELKSISDFTNGHDGTMDCKQCNSFAQWCIDNNRQDILNRWDYELNIENPFNILRGVNKKYYFKCPNNLHNSELKDINNFVSGHEGSMICNQCNSFEQWCIDNSRIDVLNRWDYELNKVTPLSISYASRGKYYFKCPVNKHSSELKEIQKFTLGQEGSIKCNQCNSLVQWGIDNISFDFLEKYWDYEKNKNIDPWKINKSSNKKVWIKCQEKDYHGSYLTAPDKFLNGRRCPYCSGGSNKKIHILDSLGNMYPKSIEVWSDKNTINPYEVSPSSHRIVWWECQNKEHKSFERSIKESKTYDFRCPECQFSKGEKKIQKCLINNKVEHIPQKEFKELFGTGGGNLSYDFYLPQYNLLIEYQGEQHERYVKGFHKIKEGFEKQKEHDRRKREYAKSHNINLLEIWYYDFDGIEQILIDNNIIPNNS